MILKLNNVQILQRSDELYLLLVVVGVGKVVVCAIVVDVMDVVDVVNSVL